MKHEIRKTGNFSVNPDLLQLAIPSSMLIDSLIPKDLTVGLQQMIENVNRSFLPLQTISEQHSKQLIELSKQISQINKSKIDAFQSIANSLQPLILAQTKIFENLPKLLGTSINDPTINAIKTLGSFRAFSVFEEINNQFDQKYNLENVTKEDIEKTIEENIELINEVNEVIIKGELDGVSPGDTPALIYTFLIKRVPKLSQRTYGIIVLIFTTSVLIYGLYSDYSTNGSISNHVIPKLETNSENINKLEENINNLTTLSINQYEKVESTNQKIDSLNNKLDSIIKEMKTNKERITEPNK